SKSDHIGAFYHFNKTIELKQSHAFAYYHRGLLSFQLNEHQNAISDFNSAINLRIPYNKECYDLGLVKYFANDFSGASACFAEAITNPIFEKVNYNAALEKFKEKDWTGAIDDLNKVLKSTTSDFEAYYLRA